LFKLLLFWAKVEEEAQTMGSKGPDTWRKEVFRLAGEALPGSCLRRGAQQERAITPPAVHREV
jgi:hypothetical protein